MDSFTEKRKHARVESRVPIQYKLLKEPEVKSAGVTKNLSEGGIRFETDKFISLACRLVVELEIPTLTKNIKAISKVAWIKKDPTGEKYEVGNQFLEISRQDKQLISQYVDDIGQLTAGQQQA